MRIGLSSIGADGKSHAAAAHEEQAAALVIHGKEMPVA
jgi:hypothetical protein